MSTSSPINSIGLKAFIHGVVNPRVFGSSKCRDLKILARSEPRIEGLQMLEEIRKRLAAVPFVPFSIRLADGREVGISHPETVWMPAPGVLHIWNQGDNASDRINPLLIVSVRGEESWAA